MSLSRGRGRSDRRNPQPSHLMFSNTGSSRGGFSSRGGRGGGFRFTKRQGPAPDVVKHPLGELVAELSNSDLEPEDQNQAGTATIQECKSISSYNWMNENTPAIMVPGKPPLWTPLKEPVQLKQDGGDFFRDENAARYPSYPTEPAVQAILRSDPAFPTSSIDIFACGSTMGNLLRFVRRIEKPFRFEVEVTGNTVFFVRKENSPKELIEGIRGFGHTFPEAYTTWEDDVKGSGTHQRLIQYSFGGHKCLVRFECDGYLDRLVAGSASTEVASAEGSFDVDSLAHALHKTSVTQAFDYNLDHLMVRTGGSNVPQACTFDLKTRSKSRGHDIDMADILPSLYIKQIPNFIVAYHNGYGVFDRGIEVKNFKKETKKWETENADALERLAILLCKIVRMARSDKKGLLEVYCPSVDRLEIRKQFGEGKHALPLRLREEWAGTHEQLVGSSVLSDARDSRNSSNSPELVEKLYYSIESDSDDDGSKDFTACSADSCGYCGRCSY